MLTKHSWTDIASTRRLHLPSTMETRVCLICIATFAVGSFAVLAQPAVAQGGNTTLPLTYPGQVLQGGGSQVCPTEAQRGIARSEVRSDTRRLLQESVVPLLQQNFSCSVSNGWRRVAYLNMSDPSQQCPSVWREITTPHRVCGRRSTGNCDGLTYTTGIVQYNQVCGRIIGYQVGNTDSFGTGSSLIDSYYVDGISVTHGSPRQHIWTFAAGYDEQTSPFPTSHCPCITGNTAAQSSIPSFVGQNYFCESGLTVYPGINGPFYSNGDPLWDGQGCGLNSTCCTFNSPPWFNVQLPSPTTNNIEVRICSNVGISQEDTPIQLMELYVKWTGNDQHTYFEVYSSWVQIVLCAFPPKLSSHC